MRILFVCLGNICRSPTAHGVFRDLVAREPGSPPVSCVDSAGTGAYHVGEPPDPRTHGAARQRGYDLGALRARQLVRDDFERFDLLLAMDRSNLRHLRQLAPSSAVARERAHLFLEYAGCSGLQEVPDPYQGGVEGFEQVLDLVEEGAHRLLARLRKPVHRA